MKPRELLELIEEGENLTCEFKRKFSTTEKIAREMIAFANTKGGYLVIGVDDDKEIIGVESEKAEAELIYDAANNFCEPPLNINIDYVEVKGKEVVVVEIFESDNKPHRIQDYLKELDVNQSVVHIRVNDKSVQASKEMIRILKARSSQMNLKKYSIGPNEKAVFEFLDNYERISVKELSDYINISERRASRTLVKLVRANMLFLHTKDNGEEYFTSAQ
ncbi:MAG: transcriptional regulator [Ignavibacteria bacterium RIFOXYB2_FULL_35_12]|nr:MAG: transcriptional regulator [Ignavibacteria bacterium GWA2_36_19]OGU52098.1 MAG: transcriptional regulator [Ignavibacteria bacterium GWC2_35_8]OGU62978.1 MAG: transcriptional regulator [Ignavibacteria bacterium GWF2_35_20]OGU83566.1 MAG: transcriptional regulator [Ignavibacteria bacterium RBG_16_35_7]OGU86571.1 MAG: transcriptional regulator [Ignavibacteria bacterium RIFOXYC12_FULL_35_11]OGU89033.1 MAG: transcriptional regulator [Ignavibacteria bacterium RIFOXYA12_FULL_35_25]OGU93338.1 